jgi:hypothetical protein
MVSRRKWATWTDAETVARRAAGRRHHLTARGTAAVLARALGVSRWTAARDIRALLAEMNAPRPCPLCGTEVALVPVAGPGV